MFVPPLFYDAVLSPLGYVRVWEDETAMGYGSPGGDDKFAIRLRPRGIIVPGEGFHVAFAASCPEAVTAFHRAALEHGGKDNGGAGLHPEYGPGYRIEATLSVPHEGDRNEDPSAGTCRVARH